MQTQEYDLDVVWNGAIGHDVYLCALKGFDPIAVRGVEHAQKAAETNYTIPTSQLIIRALSARGSLTQTELASACNRASRATRKALMRLAERGTVVLEQPCLLAMGPRHGQLWRLK